MFSYEKLTVYCIGYINLWEIGHNKFQRTPRPVLKRIRKLFRSFYLFKTKRIFLTKQGLINNILQNICTDLQYDVALKHKSHVNSVEIGLRELVMGTYTHTQTFSKKHFLSSEYLPQNGYFNQNPKFCTSLYFFI